MRDSCHFGLRQDSAILGSGGKKEKRKAVSIVFLLLLCSDLSHASCAVYRRVLKHEPCLKIVFLIMFLKVYFCRKGSAARSKQC